MRRCPELVYAQAARKPRRCVGRPKLGRTYCPAHDPENIAKREARKLRPKQPRFDPRPGEGLQAVLARCAEQFPT